MSSSQGSETVSDWQQRSMIESVSSIESVEVEKKIKDVEKREIISVTQSLSKEKIIKEVVAETKESSRSFEEGGLVKSLTESYSKKIAAGELVMPAVPRPKSFISRENSEEGLLVSDANELQKPKDSPGTTVVSELEIKIKARSPSVLTTENTVTSGSTELKKSHLSENVSAKEIDQVEKIITHKTSTDSETEFLATYGVESVAYDNSMFSEDDDGLSLPLSERKKIFEESFTKRPPPILPIRKSLHERSMSLPVSEISDSVKVKKRYFEGEMKKEIIVEQIISQSGEEVIEKEAKVDDTLLVKEKVIEKQNEITSTKLSETLVEKSETENNEKEEITEVLSSHNKRPDFVPLITVSGSDKKPTETASLEESEDTQSESDITPEDARAVDNADTPWDVSGPHSGGLSPKDDLFYAKETNESGIGRWVGQEDLSKPTWDKDEEVHASQYKLPIKWERTRSEGGSPKDHYVYTPEEHYPDTVWEVPVQEQLEKEEMTLDIPIEKQVIIEKDEEEEEEYDGVKKGKLTEEEAKEIAEEILEYIQFEVENRSSFLTNDMDENTQGLILPQVSDYLRRLTESQDLDEQDLQIIENVLLREHGDQVRKPLKMPDTTASSMDITDEDLRSTGAGDISPIENQMFKLEQLEEEDNFKATQEMSSISQENYIKIDRFVEKDQMQLQEVGKNIVESMNKSVEEAQELLTEENKMMTDTVEKDLRFELEIKNMISEEKVNKTPDDRDWETANKTILQTTKAITSETVKETVKENTVEKLKKLEVQETEVSNEELSAQNKNDKETKKDELKDFSEGTIKHAEKDKIAKKTVKKEGFEAIFENTHKADFGTTLKKGKVAIDAKMNEDNVFMKFEKDVKDRILEEIKENEAFAKVTGMIISEGKVIRILEKEKENATAREHFQESEVKTTKTIEKEPLKDGEMVSTHTKLSETEKTYSKVEKSVTSEFISEDEKFQKQEILIGKRLDHHSSEDSPRSASMEDSAKSPPLAEEIASSTSSTGKATDVKSDKSDIVFRHSSSSGVVKGDRRSGTDVEPYSSSGESHYHSFEQSSSRPCSSDVEGLLAANVGTAGSSEYESAVSHSTTSKQITSTDFHTAVSSLSSRESIKSLDSESSGHLGSVEVSSEASETLIPSALELEKDIETPEVMFDSDIPLDLLDKRSVKHHQERSRVGKLSVDDDYEVVSESEIVSWGGEASEEEESVPVTGEEALPIEDCSQQMKRSHEMTFQPEPIPIQFSDSFDSMPKDNSIEKVVLGTSLDETLSIASVPDERFGTSLEDTGSILSMSLSTTSEPSAIRTVIELSRTDSEKMDGSLTVSAASIDSICREDSESVVAQTQQSTSEISTSTLPQGVNKKMASVTITTSSSDEQGIPSVSTQVTSVSRKSSVETLIQANGPTQADYIGDYDDVEPTKSKKTTGHKRKESTSNFVPTMMWNLSEARTQKIGKADFTEIGEEYTSDKYVYDITLTEKEVKNDEKKESDDSEKLDERFDHELEKYALERKISEGEEAEEFKDYDSNRPLSQTSRTDSESGRRPVSSVFSEDQPDSELSELMKQGSSETEKEDPLERPLTPEPEDFENKDITPEFSSEAQASVTELEMEYSGAYSRRNEYASHVSPIREERFDLHLQEGRAEELLEDEKPERGLHSQTSLESTIAEKHELETGEKEILRASRDSICSIPDITVTQYMTSEVNESFEPTEPIKETSEVDKISETPCSSSINSSTTSADTGKEYSLDDTKVKRTASLSEEKEVNESKDDKESVDSPSSDSFEMLDKPDLCDEYVIIEEVGKEAKENDQEGKSIEITSKKRKTSKIIIKDEEEERIVESPPAPVTKMTNLKYFPGEEDSDMFSFDSESPPQPPTRRFVDKLRRKPSKEEKEEAEYDQHIEQSKKWVEMQFQGEQPANIVGGIGYEVEYERAPLEDIKEEDLNELDSSRIGSMESHKESIGSFSSVKDSFSSTPDYDVLAGRKYFTRSGDHDDVSMSSLQEFELIEKKIMENGKKSGSSSSQDSLSSKKLGTSSKSGQGDDVSQASLREFENLENACATVVKMESKAKQEEQILTEIDEGHESQISESESCETVSAVVKGRHESECEDLDKKIFEIDEIIKQAQSNVEKFSELQSLEKIESMGRGDSYEEVAKVPDLELDTPMSNKPGFDFHNPKVSKTTYSTQVVTKKKIQQWRQSEGIEEPGSKTKVLTQEGDQSFVKGCKKKSISVDSLELQTKGKQTVLEEKDDTVSLDSYKTSPIKSEGYGLTELSRKSDSMEEVSGYGRHPGSSSADYSLSGRDDSGDMTYQPPPRSDFMLGSTDSLDPSSSAGTHATYQYETDSVMSSSFTSGDSNTMVDSTDNLDLLISGQSVIDLSKDFKGSKPEEWLEDLEVDSIDPVTRKLKEEKSFQKIETKSDIQKVTFHGPDADKMFTKFAETIESKGQILELRETDEDGHVHVKKVFQEKVLVGPKDPRHKEMKELEEKTQNSIRETKVHTEKISLGYRQPFVTETVEPLYDSKYSHIVHKTTQMLPEVEKVVFSGPDADKALTEYVNSLNTAEEVDETEEVDEDGNVHIKRIIRHRTVVTPNIEKSVEIDQLKTGTTINQKIPAISPYAEKTLREYVEPDISKIPLVLDAEEEFHERTQSFEPEEIFEAGEIYRERSDSQSGMVKSGSLGDELSEELSKYFPRDYFNKETLPGCSHTDDERQMGIQKVVFTGPDAEEQFQEYLGKMPTQEVEEIEEVDEDGNVHVKKIIKERIVVRKHDLDRKSIDQSSQKIERIVFRGSDPEKTMLQFSKSLVPEEEIIEETDEFGNVHRKKILRQKILIQPDLTDEALTTEVKKIKFTGPDAEKQLAEYMEKMKMRKFEEKEEIDKEGNIHIRKIQKEVVVVRPDDLYEEMSGKGVQKDSTVIQKIVFSGEDPEKSLQQYDETLGSDVVEIEEEDEFGNIHRKKVLRQRVLIRPEDLGDRELTKEVLEECLKNRPTTFHHDRIDVGYSGPIVSEIIEPLDEKDYSHIVRREIRMEPQVEKISFRGPDADAALKKYIETMETGEEVQEIEEVDDMGNVHVKRITQRKMIIKPEDLEKMGLTGDQLGEYLTKLELQTFEGLDDTSDPSPFPSTSFINQPTLTEANNSSILLTGRLIYTLNSVINFWIA